MELQDTVYGPFGIARSIRKRVEITNRPRKVDGLEVANLEDVVERACKEGGPFNPQFTDVQGDGMVFARIDSGRFATGGVPFSAVLYPDPRVPVSQSKTVNGTTSKDGYLRLCNFPIRRRVAITIRFPDGSELSESVEVTDGNPRLVTLRQRAFSP